MLFKYHFRIARSVIIAAIFLFYGMQTALSADKQPKNAKARIVLIDLRDSTEYSIEHIKGALNITCDTLEDAVATKKIFGDKNVRIKLYSNDEASISTAKDTFERLGFYNVESLGTLEDAKVRINDVKATKVLRSEENK